MIPYLRYTALAFCVALASGCVSSGSGMASGSGSSSDALVPDTEFNATGQIPCAQYAGQPMGRCDFGVIREGNGNGRIFVTMPDRSTRVIGFEMNTPAWTEPSGSMTVDRNADLYLVRIGDARLEIPEAVMTGG